MKRIKNTGFTLIELMIVIAIIAILASILVPNFGRSRAQGQLAACKGNLKAIAVAAELYASDNDGKYPATLNIRPDSDLVIQYLKTTPICPTGTYKDENYSYHLTCVSPYANYYVYCRSSATHTAVGIPEYYPRYDTRRGGIIDQAP